MEKMNFDFLKAGINEGRFTTISKNAKASDEIPTISKRRHR